MIVSPYGSWRSPITSELIVAESVRLDQVALDGAAIYWSESQPQKQGRCLIYRAMGGTAEPVTPDGDANFNVRSRVHEYGGGAFCVADGTVWFSNFADQRLYCQAPGAAPRPITPPGPLRYADAISDARRGRLICVGEDHAGAGPPANLLLTVDAAGARAPQRLVSGNDFYAAPRLSPDGTRLAWLTWNHPDMPWIGAELWSADLGADGTVRDARHVAGGGGEAVLQPEWSPDGALWFVSDRDGWWNLFQLRGAAIRPMAPMQAEFGRAPWAFGMSAYAFIDAARVACACVEDGLWRLSLLETGSGRLRPLAVPFTEIAQLRAGAGRVVFIGGAADRPAALVELDPDSLEHRVIRRSAELPEALLPYLSTPEPLRFPSADGRTAHAFWYPPRNPGFTAPEGEKVPVLVKSHGGPTAAASGTLSLGTQFWTSRGIGVLDVNYGGSTGYGRAYRLLLERQWGIVDVQDCIAAARHVVARHGADPARLAISGGSAGGYTTLRALTWAPPGDGEPMFRAGASYYGVSDLEALARDTHKFEARYLDWLVGPYPQAKHLYEDRAPIRHAGNLSVPVIFFQGAEDRVVPPSQTERMVEALRGRGIPVAYFLFEGEQHGFRSAGAMRRCLDAELMFYATLLLGCGLRF